jgi:hypothetical protein
MCNTYREVSIDTHLMFLGDNVQLTKCDGNVTDEGDGVFAAKGLVGKFPNRLCVVDFAVRGEDDSTYTISVDVYVDHVKAGMVGVFFNAQDSENFDVVWFS